jgi:hypothetical protein
MAIRSSECAGADRGPGLPVNVPPAVRRPSGNAFREYHEGDEPRVCRVMELAWWPGWDDGSLQPGLSVALPGSWFMVVHQERSQNVATGVGRQDRSGPRASGGGPAWFEVNPNDACG